MNSHPDSLGGFDYLPPPVAGGQTYRAQIAPRQVFHTPSEMRLRDEDRIRRAYSRCGLVCAKPIVGPLSAEGRIALYAERYEAGLETAFHPDDCRDVAEPILVSVPVDEDETDDDFELEDDE